MTRRPSAALLAAGVLGLGSALACTSLRPRSDNVAACERYVAHVNTLEPCLGVRYDAANLCQDVDRTGADLGPWYECLVANSACDGTQPRLEVEGCHAPVIELAAVTDPG